MIVTKEQQERLVENYRKKGANTDNIIGCVEGINATIELVDKLMKEQALTTPDVVGQSEQLVAFGIWLDKNDKHLENGNITETVKEYLKSD